MRDELLINIINMLNEYVDQSNISDLRWKLELMLSDYDIEKRQTELAILTEDKNEAILRKYIASKLASGRTERTLRYYKNSLTFFFDRVGKDFDTITADDIRKYLAIRVNIDKISKVSANNERRNLSAFYKWLQTEEIILKNPMGKVDQMKVNKQKKKAFSEMEVEQIRSACRTNKEIALIELLLSTWCRVSEVAQIKLTDIDEDEILVHGKGEKDRTVYLNAKAQLSIQKYLNERSDVNPYLFARAKYAGDIAMMAKSSKGKKRSRLFEWYKDDALVAEDDYIEKSTIESIVRSIGKRAGVNNVHPHRFRRTGATMALKAGMPLITVSKLLGHASIGVTQLYLDISDDELEEAHRKYVR